MRAHPAVWLWDLGNENSNCTIPPDRAKGDEWLERMTGALRAGERFPLVLADPALPSALVMAFQMRALAVTLGAKPADLAQAVAVEVVAAITLSSVDRLKLKEGSTVTVIIKATEVMLATED